MRAVGVISCLAEDTGHHSVEGVDYSGLPRACTTFDEDQRGKGP